MTINEITTNYNEETAHAFSAQSNAEAIDATYYEYHGKYEDNLDGDIAYGYSIVEVAI